MALGERWGRADLFKSQLAAVAADLGKAVADAKLDAERRTDAARRLLAVSDTPESIQLVLGQVTARAAPELQTAMLESLSASRSATAGEAIVERYAKLTPTAQRSAIELLLRREPWTAALLKAVEGGAISNKDLQPQHWRALTTHPTDAIADKAQALQQASGKAISPDRKAIVEQFMAATTQAGDLARGRAVYEKNCQVCHVIDGQGGKVGPELTGIGAKPKADNLIDILDPNRAVEGTYRQWTARTTAGDLIDGRLSAESATSVEITDATGQVHTFQRDKLRSLTVIDRSVMPEGFEQLSQQEIADLLEFLAASKVKN
jgi:putative heme-binding domain-containing protein